MPRSLEELIEAALLHGEGFGDGCSVGLHEGELFMRASRDWLAEAIDKDPRLEKLLSSLTRASWMHVSGNPSTVRGKVRRMKPHGWLDAFLPPQLLLATGYLRVVEREGVKFLKVGNTVIEPRMHPYMYNASPETQKTYLDRWGLGFLIDEDWEAVLGHDGSAVLEKSIYGGRCKLKIDPAGSRLVVEYTNKPENWVEGNALVVRLTARLAGAETVRQALWWLRNVALLNAAEMLETAAAYVEEKLGPGARKSMSCLIEAREFRYTSFTVKVAGLRSRRRNKYEVSVSTFFSRASIPVLNTTVFAMYAYLSRWFEVNFLGKAAREGPRGLYTRVIRGAWVPADSMTKKFSSGFREVAYFTMAEWPGPVPASDRQVVEALTADALLVKSVREWVEMNEEDFTLLYRYPRWLVSLLRELTTSDEDGFVARLLALGTVPGVESSHTVEGLVKLIAEVRRVAEREASLFYSNPLELYAWLIRTGQLTLQGEAVYLRGRRLAELLSPRHGELEARVARMARILRDMQRLHVRVSA